MDSIESRIKDIIADHLGVSVSRIESDADIREIFSVDSLDMIEIVMTIEDEFEIEISDEQWEAAKTVEDLVKLVADLYL